MGKSFNRRVLLRGLGGAVVAAPFLSSVAERAAKTQGLPPPPAPKRLIVLFTYHGCLTNRWFPAKSHGPLSKADYTAMPTLAPMAPYADKLLMVRGIRAMNEWSFEGTLGQMNDAHTNASGSIFTLPPADPQRDIGVGQQHREVRRQADRTIARSRLRRADQPERRPAAVHPDRRRPGQHHQHHVGHLVRPARADLSRHRDADDHLHRLTNLFGAGPISPDTYAVARRRSVIDCVREDLNNLRRVNMSSVGQEEARQLGRASSPDGQDDRPRAMQRRHRDASWV